MCLYDSNLDLEEILFHLSTKEPYELEREAGMIVKWKHEIKVPKSDFSKETNILKKLSQFNRYVKSNVRLKTNRAVLEYIESKIHKMWRMSLCYLRCNFPFWYLKGMDCNESFIWRFKASGYFIVYWSNSCLFWRSPATILGDISRMCRPRFFIFSCLDRKSWSTLNELK